MSVHTILKALVAMPKAPGIYKMLNKDNHVLYVGKANNLANRVRNYTILDKLPNRLKMMVFFTEKVEFIVTPNEVNALLLEAQLIRSLSPKYNILLKDDKSYPYLMVQDSHKYPGIKKYRGEHNAKNSYYGPFPSVYVIDQVILIMQKMFQLRTCMDSTFNNRVAPCIKYQIKRCSAPCVNKISHKDYSNSVLQAKQVLSGDIKGVVRELSGLMDKAKESYNYEQAAIYRDRIRALQKINTNLIVNCPTQEEVDLIAIFQGRGSCCIQVFVLREGQCMKNNVSFMDEVHDVELADLYRIFVLQFYQSNVLPKKIYTHNTMSDQKTAEEALKEMQKTAISINDNGRKNKGIIDMLGWIYNNAEIALYTKLDDKKNSDAIFQGIQKLFSIDQHIERIEVYDNSHISGTNQVGVMVVATRDGLQKDQYRKFSMENSGGGDDCAMMQEVMSKRFSKSLANKNHVSDLPDLLLIDGGIGQVHAVLQQMSVMGINVPCIGISKGPDRNAGHEKFILPDGGVVTIEHNSKVLYYLQVIRDEAHKFAINSHRKKRSKNFLQSSLEGVPGIGKKRMTNLLTSFGSLSEIKQATIDELAMVPGISHSLAGEIRKFFDS